jgi:uncharacterized protein YndB with AHSA1/START domain
MSASEQTDRPALILTRVFAAPRPLVFRAWIEPERAALWWGPQGFEILSCHMDVRPGGSWRMSLRGPSGAIQIKQGVYREIVPPERLVFTWRWLDFAGVPAHETIVTISFEEQSSGTKLTLHQAVFETAEIRDGHYAGWSGCMDRFAEYLAIL